MYHWNLPLLVVSLLHTCAIHEHFNCMSAPFGLQQSPWYNHTGSLGVKHQLTYLLGYNIRHIIKCVIHKQPVSEKGWLSETPYHTSFVCFIISSCLWILCSLDPLSKTCNNTIKIKKKHGSTGVPLKGQDTNSTWKESGGLSTFQVCQNCCSFY